VSGDGENEMKNNSTRLVGVIRVIIIRSLLRKTHEEPKAVVLVVHVVVVLY
jgi:hypothetical protein